MLDMSMCFKVGQLAENKLSRSWMKCWSHGFHVLFFYWLVVKELHCCTTIIIIYDCTFRFRCLTFNGFLLQPVSRIQVLRCAWPTLDPYTNLFLFSIVLTLCVYPHAKVSNSIEDRLQQMSGRSWIKWMMHFCLTVWQRLKVMATEWKHDTKSDHHSQYHHPFIHKEISQKH